MGAQLALLPEYLTAHLQLTLLALALGTLVSVPLGIVATRVRWLEQPVLAVTSVIQTIPGLALLAVMVPLLAALELPSIGYLPAIIGLTLYSLLPILRNTVTGIQGVDAAYVEAARGVGMTEGQVLRRVELPLAMPVLVAGLRTSTVWIVGIATLSTPVGATSLGNYIFSGLQTRNFAAVLVGCVAAAGLALLLDGLIWALEKGTRERRRGWTVASLLLLGLLFLYTASSAWPDRGAEEAPVIIGSKTFTEQYVLSEMLAQRIEDQTEAPARVKSSLGSTVAFDALVDGTLDLYVDYSGTLWATLMEREETGVSREQVLAEVRVWLGEKHGVEVLASIGFENAYALAMREEQAARLGVVRISELAEHAPTLEIGGDYEFFQRPEWTTLVETYGLSFARRRSMDSSFMYQAVAQGEVDVISAFSTDGRIDAYDLRVLEDDRAAIPPYDAILLARPGLSEERPAVARAVAALDGRIDAATMRRLNRAVDEAGRDPATVARAFLRGGAQAVADSTSQAE